MYMGSKKGVGSCLHSCVIHILPLVKPAYSYPHITEDIRGYQGSEKGESALYAILKTHMEGIYCTSGFSPLFWARQTISFCAYCLSVLELIYSRFLLLHGKCTATDSNGKFELLPQKQSEYAIKVRSYCRNCAALPYCT